MKACLMNRDVNHPYGVYEWWQAENGEIFQVYFDDQIGKTIVLPYDMEHDRVEIWKTLGVWHKDMTGGRAIRELGYEPVEEAKHEER
jgi:hypothetical protein